MSKHIYILLFLLAISTHSYSQKNSFTNELRFSTYLLNKEQYAEALFVLNIIDTNTISLQQKDSLHYEKGWLFYTKKN